ncbi:substrate-binding domain-containing protein [Rhodobium gokarnense]|uniref:Ribose transport system substrate-binding protein n=1 Tax=Rhodobium gokarnense TaxID=364296 RepID=A0ABT3HF84_9HYPH|nr:substrate-binding domain-containing protein [Rhodobium gokarnense]MCW2308989.1 ribose transport system substrate-binding protein [Rhodobium gokarnense]
MRKYLAVTACVLFASAMAAQSPLAKELSVPAYSTEDLKSTGPNGEPAASAMSLELTAEDRQKLKDGKFKVAFAFHMLSNEMTTTELAAIKDTFNELGVELVGVTDAQMKVETQVSNIESLMALQPDLLLSTPIDPISTAASYRAAAEQGAKLVFVENIAHGMVAGKDYVSCIAADNYGNGVAAADIMAEAIGGEGEVGVVFFDANFWVTDQRAEGFKDRIAEKYPNIKVVAEGGFTDQNRVTEVVDGILVNHPQIDGIFAVWDIPAEGTIAAAKSAGRGDLIVTTIDLGANAARIIAEDGMIKGLGAQRPYDQGVAIATTAAYALIDKKAPEFVAVPPLPVVRANLLKAWEEAYHEPAPDNIAELMK